MDTSHLLNVVLIGGHAIPWITRNPIIFGVISTILLMAVITVVVLVARSKPTVAYRVVSENDNVDEDTTIPSWREFAIHGINDYVCKLNINERVKKVLSACLQSQVPVENVTTPLARKLAWEYKSLFGERKYTDANRIIVREWVCEQFSKIPDMRTSDKIRQMDITIELCLLPTKFAVEAADLAKSREFRNRRSAVALPK